MLKQAIEALRSIHHCKVTHGDIALRNIVMSDNKEKILIIDFGMSSVCENKNLFLKEA